jgi:predicted phage terminase large subunit-like protein
MDVDLTANLPKTLDWNYLSSQVIPYLDPDEAVQLQTLLSGLSLPKMKLREFVPLSWPIIDPNVPYRHNWHIDAICDHLEAVVWGQIPNLIINIPPRHMKSSLVSCIWHPWVWSFRPWTHWLYFSYSEGFSIRDNVRARRIIRSDFYQEAFGHIFKLAGDQNLKGRFENSQGGHRQALGVGGATGEGGDFIVGDDLLKIDNRHSDTIREGCNEFWATTVSTRKNTAQSSTVIICQRIHEHDIVGYCREKEEEGGTPYEVLKIPAEFEGERYWSSIGWTDPREEHGDLIWEERFPRENVDRLKRTLGSEQAAAQLQQRPTPETGEVFKKYNWRFWYPQGNPLPPVKVRMEDGSFVDCEVGELPGGFDEEVQSWDMAFKELASSSFVVGQLWGRREANAYLLDQERARMDLPKTLTAVTRMTDNWPNATAKYVEDKANGPAVIQMLQSKIPGLIAVSPMGSKVARANAVTPVIESGNVYLPHPHVAPWVWDLIAELSAFPNAANDDQVDSLTQALMKLLVKLKKKEAGTWGRRR